MQRAVDFAVGLLVGLVLAVASHALAQVKPKEKPKVLLVRLVDRETDVVCYSFIGGTLTGAEGLSCIKSGMLDRLPPSKVIPIE